jgi:hypothetical protein
VGIQWIPLWISSLDRIPYGGSELRPDGSLGSTCRFSHDRTPRRLAGPLGRWLDINVGFERHGRTDWRKGAQCVALPWLGVLIKPPVGVLRATNYDLQASGKEMDLKAHHQSDMFHQEPAHKKNYTVAFR